MQSKGFVSIMVGILVVFAVGWTMHVTNFNPLEKPVKKYNRLGQEKSPYLLQHKDNPVNWFSWGEEAFKAAKDENKIIFLSIGYSTCHWCHVMEHDSFEKEEVAAILNEHFISIKLDREERPDIDQVYMDAVIAMTGQGGWPMSVFLTPDLKPFFGGTFFWKDQFIQLLTNIARAWQTQPDQIKEAGNQLVGHFQNRQLSKQTGDLNLDTLKQAFYAFQTSFDSTYGGFGGTPKFPRSIDLSLLLRIYRRTQNQDALYMVTHTLNQMAYGGMYDHLGGGFHRYSTDSQWLVPHFEKMLYDNALLTLTYLEAYQVTKNKMYAEIAKETLDYILRDMTGTDGGFYSAEDADSEGEEGKFYVWKYEELKKVLTSQELELVKKVYGVTERGNFFDEHSKTTSERANIFSLQKGEPWSVKQDPMLKEIHKKLFEIRDQRIRPHLDDKILTDWNGLMIAAMSKGYQVLGDKKYLEAAQKASKFIKSKLYQKGSLLRRYREGESKYNGTLSDYAYLIFGLTNLYESDFNEEWLVWVLQLQKSQNELFWDTKEGGYFTAPQETKDLFIRSKDSHDGAIPSGNSVTALNLIKLFHLTFDPQLKTYPDKLFSNGASQVNRYPPAYAMMLVALDYQLDQSFEIAVIGKVDDPATQELKDFFYQEFLPNKVIAFHDPTGKTNIPLLKDRPLINDQTTIYVCENQVCQKPVNNVEEVKKLVKTIQPYELLD